MKKILIGSLILVSSFSWSQKNVFVTISPKVEGVDLLVGTDLTGLDGKKFNLDHFDYYVSNIIIVHDGGQELVLPQEVYLFEPENHVKYLGLLNVNTIEEIRFGVGVPSNINTINGENTIDITAYPEGHPLSYQTPSMHWGWTAGYMHMIVGGTVDTDMDDAPDTDFELHNLGDNNYANVVLPVIATETYENQLDINMNCNLDVWLTNIDLGAIGILHGTTNENQDVMKNAEILPVFDQSATAASEAIEKIPGKIWFFNHTESMEISWEGLKSASYFQLIDVQGRIVKDVAISAISGSVKLNDIPSGAYSLLFFDDNGTQLKSINTVR